MRAEVDFHKEIYTLKEPIGQEYDRKKPKNKTERESEELFGEVTE